ncbi:MAG: 4-hydroxythreonine-4-phosphate dehydrogenase PdxA [Phycisphaerales bacterium]|nr:MAG: 4-hydroxythreonine-4-phosphate dehydrogenase PdxA [Phycisphaerales bacterium]
MGDPGGIGAEVLVKAIADAGVRASARLRIYGVGSAMLEAAEKAGVEPTWWRVEHSSPLLETAARRDVVLVDFEKTGEARTRPWPREADKRSGALSFAFVNEAIRDAARPVSDPLRAHGIVTAPINKKAWDLAGQGRFPGHTELLAVRLRAERAGMMFVSPRLKVILATAHLPLMDVRNVLTIGCVFEAIDLGAEACRKLGIERPRVAVCGLNPHAGEDGLLGDEETRIIAPAVRVAQDQGIEASGPWPGDTVFNAAVAGKFDLVVAMYHDQGLIPVKLLDRDAAVNVTVGLPTVRTSPDHGTAFDIAGKNKAEAGSTKAAILLAARMARNET